MEKHTAIIFGHKARKVYRSTDINFFGDSYYYDSPIERESFIGNTKIGEYEIFNPPLRNNESLYLHELGASTVIDRAERSTDNKWIYYVDHVVEVIEDDETKKSYKLALERIKEYKQYEADEEDTDPLPRSEPPRPENNKWWKLK